MGMLDAEHYDTHAEIENPLRFHKETAHVNVLATFHHLDGHTSFTFLPSLGNEHEHDSKLLSEALMKNLNNFRNPINKIEYPFKVAKKEWSICELPYTIHTGWIEVDITDSVRRICEYINDLQEQLKEANDYYERTANDYRYAEAHDKFGDDIKRIVGRISYLNRQLINASLSDDAAENAEADKRAERDEMMQYIRESSKYDEESALSHENNQRRKGDVK